MPDYTDEFNQERAKNKSVIKKKKKKKSDQINRITGAEFFVVFCLAMFKDVLDWILLLSAGIGFIINRITNIVITGILWLWCVIRLHKFPTKKFVGSFFIEMIPVLGTFSPTWTIFILIIYAEQRGHLPKWAEKLAKGKI